VTGKILVIEDDPCVRGLIAAQLMRHGHTVFGTHDGRDGMRALGWFRPDIIITDLFMPNMDGIEVIREVRRADPDAMIIAISGGAIMAAEDALRLAMKLGAECVLEEPFKTEHLLAAVRAALSSQNRCDG
jgi:DNA-binding response OmpR family regulator